tara:strand:- start:135 stop:578 length:444 start_codon:yes stop_codon:yes gene_type:complete
MWIYLFLFFIAVYSFQKKATNKNLIIRLYDKNPKILNFDFEKLINELDEQKLIELDGKVPRRPQNESEIKDDSFEGYLKKEFNNIDHLETFISFKDFYEWRKKIGTLLTEDEIKYIFDYVVNNPKGCGLMEFIQINDIIDENDGADF